MDALADFAEQARNALERRDFKEAVACFERHVLAHPDDLDAVVELGLAHVLAGDLERFEKVHCEVRGAMEARVPTGRLAAMWEIHRSIFARIAQAAVLSVAASAMVAGCHQGPEPASPAAPTMVPSPPAMPSDPPVAVVPVVTNPAPVVAPVPTVTPSPVASPSPAPYPAMRYRVSARYMVRR